MRNYVQEGGPNFENQFLNMQIKNKIYLEGYFQSENFFKDIGLKIREDLLIDPPNDNKNMSALNKIKGCNSIAVHFRFFDDAIVTSNKNLQNMTNTSIDYYKSSILKMNLFFPNAHYFIFSDQPNKVSKYLPLDHSQMTIINHNKNSNMAYADLWLMSQCKHFIIAKSTFSWWGAWLSNNEEKIIIAPKIGNDRYTFWQNKSLIPKKWIQI